MAEKLCVRWNEFQDNISKTFGNLRKDLDFSDVTLACDDGEQIEAHRVVLVASSHFFQKLFLRTKHSHPLIYLRGLKSEDLRAIIDFVYFGEAKIYQENLDKFLSVAKDIELIGLVDQFNNGVPDFEAGKEHQFEQPTSKQDKSDTKKVIWGEFDELGQLSSEPVTDSENTSLIKEAEIIQESSKEGMGVKAVPTDIDSQVRSMMEKSKNCERRICKVCGKEGEYASIRYHIERFHLEDHIVPCDQCEKSYTTRKDLRRHKRTHSDIESQITSMMEKSTTRVKSKTGNHYLHICKVCGKKGGSSSIRYHIESFHLENLVALCGQCEKSYKTRIDLKRHKQLHQD